MNVKINITFAAMKRLRKILIKSFFLLAVSLCFGINSYSNYNLRHINNEISACTSNVENSFNSHIDSLNEDRIVQSDNSDLSLDPFISIPLRQVHFPIHIFYFSIWQPPKIS